MQTNTLIGIALKGMKEISTNSSSENTQKNNPLHGKTLESILHELVDKIGWIEMNRRVSINCFFSHPTIKSSLKFLRKENWARIKVEEMYLEMNNNNNSNDYNNDFHE